MRLFDSGACPRARTASGDGPAGLVTGKGRVTGAVLTVGIPMKMQFLRCERKLPN